MTSIETLRLNPNFREADYFALKKIERMIIPKGLLSNSMVFDVIYTTSNYRIGNKDCSISIRKDSILPAITWLDNGNNHSAVLLSMDDLPRFWRLTLTNNELY